MSEKIQLSFSFFPTSNTKLAASLITLGFSPLKDHPASNHYDGEKYPIPQMPRGASGWKPGTETWYFETKDKSEFMGKTLQKMAQAFNDKKGDESLHHIADELKSLLQRDPDYSADEGHAAFAMGKTPRLVRLEKLSKELLEAIPDALICYMAGALENRERMVEAIKTKCDELVAVRHGAQGMTIFKKTASMETKRKLLKQ